MAIDSKLYKYLFVHIQWTPCPIHYFYDIQIRGGLSMKRQSLYILLIAQALLVFLLLFAQGTPKTVTLIIFGVLDLILILALIMRRWLYAEVFSFTAFFCSLFFIAFIIFMPTIVTLLLGIALVFLFLVAAFLDHIEHHQFSRRAADEYESMPRKKDILETYDEAHAHASSAYEQEKMSPLSDWHEMPVVRPSVPVTPKVVAVNRAQTKTVDHPGLEEYDVHELERQAAELERVDQQIRDFQKAMHELSVRKQEQEKQKFVAGPIIIPAKKTTARKIAYELTREAAALKNAQSVIDKVHADQKKTQVTEVVKEAAALTKAQSAIDTARADQKKMQVNEIVKEAAALRKAQEDITKVRKAQSALELRREAQTLEKAQQDIQKLQQRANTAKTAKVIKEAKQLAQVQRTINAVKKDQVQSKKNAIVREAKALEQMQKTINVLAKQKPKTKTITKIIRTPSKSQLVVTTDTGDSFHEPGCMTIKKIKKNRLTLHTTHKDALKKGFHPCNVCKP